MGENNNPSQSYTPNTSYKIYLTQAYKLIKSINEFNNDGSSCFLQKPSMLYEDNRHILQPR